MFGGRGFRGLWPTRSSVLQPLPDSVKNGPKDTRLGRQKGLHKYCIFRPGRASELIKSNSRWSPSLWRCFFFLFWQNRTLFFLFSFYYWQLVFSVNLVFTPNSATLWLRDSLFMASGLALGSRIEDRGLPEKGSAALRLRYESHSMAGQTRQSRLGLCGCARIGRNFSLIHHFYGWISARISG